MTARKIITEHVYPPIPTRAFDWSAVFDDYDGAPDSNSPHGSGPTEEAAIADLLEQVADDEVQDLRHTQGTQSEKGA